MSNESEYDWAMHDDRVRAHYEHAIEKHPYFCDRVTDCSKTGVDIRLELNRTLLEVEERIGELEAVSVIECELSEAVQAYTHGDTAHAIEELYDTIAVLLRTIDVLEGRQKLGKPEEVVG